MGTLNASPAMRGLHASPQSVQGAEELLAPPTNDGRYPKFLEYLSTLFENDLANKANITQTVNQLMLNMNTDEVQVLYHNVQDVMSQLDPDLPNFALVLHFRSLILKSITQLWSLQELHALLWVFHPVECLYILVHHVSDRYDATEGVTSQSSLLAAHAASPVPPPQPPQLPESLATGEHDAWGVKALFGNDFTTAYRVFTYGTMWMHGEYPEPWEANEHFSDRFSECYFADYTKPEREKVMASTMLKLLSSIEAQVDAPAAELRAFESRVDLIWTTEEKEIFLAKLLQYGKLFHKIALFLPGKT
ncbi:hypothetical protein CAUPRSCDRAFT_12669, partial [Caulochytrium protostelioides]